MPATPRRSLFYRLQPSTFEVGLSYKEDKALLYGKNHVFVRTVRLPCPVHCCQLTREQSKGHLLSRVETAPGFCYFDNAETVLLVSVYPLGLPEHPRVSICPCFEKLRANRKVHKCFKLIKSTPEPLSCRRLLVARYDAAAQTTPAFVLRRHTLPRRSHVALTSLSQPLCPNVLQLVTLQHDAPAGGRPQPVSTIRAR